MCVGHWLVSEIVKSSSFFYLIKFKGKIILKSLPLPSPCEPNTFLIKISLLPSPPLKSLPFPPLLILEPNGPLDLSNFRVLLCNWVLT